MVFPAWVHILVIQGDALVVVVGHRSKGCIIHIHVVEIVIVVCDSDLCLCFPGARPLSRSSGSLAVLGGAQLAAFRVSEIGAFASPAAFGAGDFRTLLHDCVHLISVIYRCSCLEKK